MSRIVNASPVRDSVPFYDRRQIVEMSSPTFSQLLKNVGDVTGDDESPLHQALTMDPHHSNIPFVLAFNNLTYSVKVRRKVSFPAISRSRSLHIAAEEIPSTRTKVLLNDICGEARDGELLAVFGASGSGM